MAILSRRPALFYLWHAVKILQKILIALSGRGRDKTFLSKLALTRRLLVRERAMLNSLRESAVRSSIVVDVAVSGRRKEKPIFQACICPVRKRPLRQFLERRCLRPVTMSSSLRLKSPAYRKKLQIYSSSDCLCFLSCYYESLGRGCFSRDHFAEAYDRPV